MERLKAALIGLGRMGAAPSVRLQGIVPPGWLPISHAEAILEIPDLQLEAVCDINADLVNEVKTRFNLGKTYTDPSALIKEEKPFFLSLATRTEGRVDLIKCAADNNVRILYLEKPIARSLSHCKEALQAAEKAKMVLGYGVNRRYHQMYRKAKQIVASGELGQLIHITAQHGVSSLYWSHPHSVDLLLYFAGTSDVEFVQGNCVFDFSDYDKKEMIPG